MAAPFEMEARPLSGRVALVSGATRGIGREIALRFAEAGASVAILAKTDVPSAESPGTIHSTADEIRALGGTCLPIRCDVREPSQIEAAIAETVSKLGPLDIVVSNVSTLHLRDTSETSLEKYDFLHGTNARATWYLCKSAVPHLRGPSAEPSDGAPPSHILIIAPPVSLNPGFFAAHGAYTASKFGMTFVAQTLAAEFREKCPGRAFCNSLWPITTISTVALNRLGKDVWHAKSRHPRIMADAALDTVLSSRSGEMQIDQLVLEKAGRSDFREYAIDPSQPLLVDLFIEPKLIACVKKRSNERFERLAELGGRLLVQQDQREGE